MPLLSSSEAGTFLQLVRERQAVIEQMSAEQLPVETSCDGGVQALLHELVLINEAPVKTGAGRRRARRQLRLGLNELLDRCDRTSATNPDVALSHAADYMESGRVGRARRLLECTLARFEAHHDVRRELARVLLASHHFNRALTHLEILCSDQPDDPSLQREAAKAATRCLSIDKAINHLERLTRLCPEDVEVAQDLTVLQEMRRTKRAATMPNSIPSISLDSYAESSSAKQELYLALAEQLYRQYGTLLIHNVYDPELIRSCEKQFLSEYTPLIQAGMQALLGLSGTRRLRVSLAISGEFNSPDFYANEFVIQLMRRLLGPTLVVGSQMALMTLPGARDQAGSVYHKGLFEHDPDDQPLTLPPAAIRCLIPLLALDTNTGVIAVKKGSQRQSRKAARELQYQTPMVPIGSCCLADASLTQKIEGNRAERLCTVIDLVYQRSWFVDRQNFRSQPPLTITGAEYAKVPGRYRKLFDWALQPFADVSRSARAG